MAVLPVESPERALMASKAQRQWEAIATEVRGHLAKLVGDMPDMGPEECRTLLEALDLARLLELDASVFDAALESLRATLEREAAYGG